MMLHIYSLVWIQKITVYPKGMRVGNPRQNLLQNITYIDR